MRQVQTQHCSVSQTQSRPTPCLTFVFCSTLVPACSNSSATWYWPSWQAAWNGVHPSCKRTKNTDQCTLIVNLLSDDVVRLIATYFNILSKLVCCSRYIHRNPQILIMKHGNTINLDCGLMLNSIRAPFLTLWSNRSSLFSLQHQSSSSKYTFLFITCCMC